MNVRVLEMLEKMEIDWNKDPEFGMKKRKISACQDYMVPLRALIRDPLAEVSETDWATIKSALLCGFEYSLRMGNFGAQVQAQFAAIAIAGFIKANSRAQGN